MLAANLAGEQVRSWINTSINDGSAGLVLVRVVPSDVPP